MIPESVPGGRPGTVWMTVRIASWDASSHFGSVFDQLACRCGFQPPPSSVGSTDWLSQRCTPSALQSSSIVSRGKSPTFESFVTDELSECMALTPLAMRHAYCVLFCGWKTRVPFFSYLVSTWVGTQGASTRYDEWASTELSAATLKQRGAAIKKVRQVWEDTRNEPVEQMLFGGWSPLTELSGEPFFEREFFDEATAFWWPAFTCRKTRRQLSRYLP